MTEQEEISESKGDSIIDSTAEKVAAAEDSSKILDSATEVEAAELPEVIAAREREVSSLFGHENPVRKAFGGVKPADLFLWRNKKLSVAVVGGATVLWILFEFLDLHLTSVLCHVLIFSVGSLFLWSNASIFINKRPAHIPDVHIPEEPFLELASLLRLEINRGLVEFRGIASGGDLKKFLTVVASLWVLSIVGSFFNFLTLAYTVLILLFTVPVMYEKHNDKVNAVAEKAISEIKKQYQVLDAKVLSKIPRLPLDKKKD